MGSSSMLSLATSLKGMWKTSATSSFPSATTSLLRGRDWEGAGLWLLPSLILLPGTFFDPFLDRSWSLSSWNFLLNYRPHDWRGGMRMTRRLQSSLRRYSRCTSQLKQEKGLQLVSDNQRILQLRKMQKKSCFLLISII